MTGLGQRFFLSGNQLQFAAAVFVCVLFIGCHAAARVDNLRSMETLMNAGQREHFVGLNEAIIINSDPELPRFDVSLGRLDVKHTVFTYHDNKIQSTLRFTKTGKYQVTLRSHRPGGQKATMMHTLTVVVHLLATRHNWLSASMVPEEFTRRPRQCEAPARLNAQSQPLS